MEAIDRITNDDDPNYPLSRNVIQSLASRGVLDVSGRIEQIPGVVANGMYSDVFRGFLKKDDGGKTEIVIKRLRFFAAEDITRLFEKEVYTWSKAKHDNVLPLLGFAFDPSTGYPMLISKRMKNGSLADCIKEKKEFDLIKIVKGLAAGLTYLHTHEAEMIHSDIKPANILVSKTGDALICDFGCSRMFAASLSLAKPTDHLKGTAHYNAYEVLTCKMGAHVFSKEADVWAFGMTVYALLAKNEPYSGLSNEQITRAVTELDLPILPASLENVDDGVKAILEDICKRCWEPEPRHRIQMTDVLAKLTDL